MTYEYHCPCGYEFDVIKHHSDMERPEHCEKCKREAKRQFVPRKVYFSGTSVNHAEYNPGLGMVIENKAHLIDECKRRDVIPIGNDYGSADKMVKEAEISREEKRQKAWESVQP